jgi:hypothetical protein
MKCVVVVVVVCPLSPDMIIIEPSGFCEPMIQRRMHLRISHRAYSLTFTGSIIMRIVVSGLTSIIRHIHILLFKMYW